MENDQVVLSSSLLNSSIVVSIVLWIAKTDELISFLCIKISTSLCWEFSNSLYLTLCSFSFALEHPHFILQALDLIYQFNIGRIFEILFRNLQWKDLNIWQGMHAYLCDCSNHWKCFCSVFKTGVILQNKSCHSRHRKWHSLKWLCVFTCLQ